MKIGDLVYMDKPGMDTGYGVIINITSSGLDICDVGDLYTVLIKGGVIKDGINEWNLQVVRDTNGRNNEGR